MLAPVTHITPLIHVRRARVLSYPGKVLVKSGQHVAALDPVASYQRQGQHVLVDVLRALRVSRLEQIDRIINRRVGEKIQKGDVLGETGGMFKRVVRAPVDGEIVVINNSGQVLIEQSGAPVELLAGISGTVTEVIPERGAIIEADGALVQGVWGNNKINMGMLLVLARSEEDELTLERLDVSMRGAVVLGGYCSNAEVLRAAQELAVRGLIFSSISTDLIPVVNSLDFPVLVLEGFGRTSINKLAYKLLTTNDKRDVSINACVWNQGRGERPELHIPLPADGEVSPEVELFKEGLMVRILSAPHTGKTGVLVAMLPGFTRISNGARARAAEVRLENNEPVIVPLANLDVLE
ncbi:MAG: hypothetical protein VB089_19520 [Anaerolineaceae bacterium]|nr:hypothetical protein [Anaerolineaceae bacterium]